MEEQLFSYEQDMDPEDIASYLRRIAKRLENGSSLTFKSSDGEIQLDMARATELEIEVERENDEMELELEITFGSADTTAEVDTGLRME